MYLTDFTVRNYRCFEDVQLADLGRLAILVGENDAGKTIMLDAVACLVGNGSCGELDYRKRANDPAADEIVLEGVFQLESHDTLPDEYRTGSGRDVFRLRKRFTPTSSEVFVRCLGFADPDFDDFNGADRQKELLRRLGLTPASREDGRRGQLAEAVQNGSLSRTTERDIRLSGFSVVTPHMPRVERIASAEYRSPDAMIQRTLQAVAASVVHPIDPITGQPRERADLAVVRQEITDRLNEEIEKAKAVLQRTHRRLQHLTVTPTIDFSRSIAATALVVDVGDGDRGLGHVGEGTKKRMWMGLLEWEQAAAKANITGSVIRLYDEPDANLHYEAQRQLFANIHELAFGVNRTQCFVCTHAIAFIDRAPCESLNLIQMASSDGQRTVHRVGDSSQKQVLAFFDQVGRAIGLTNSVLLYERGFLLVEGDSEVAGLPILYRTLYGRTMSEDGLVLVNLHSCSSWRSVVKVLLSSRMGMLQLLLDADCRDPASSAQINPTTLVNLGCPPDFLAQQVTFIGTKEYEDAFDTPVIARALDEEFPRQDQGSWEPKIAGLKADGGKLSAALHGRVRGSCIPEKKSDVTKPNIAAALARVCAANEVPRAVLTAFGALRERAGILGVGATTSR